jgi:hypothetical protein
VTAAGEGGRATTPKAADKAKKAEACKKLAPAAKKKDVAKSRRIKKAHKIELEFSDAVEGANLPDSEPADVVHAHVGYGKDTKKVTDPKAVKGMLAQRARAVKVIQGDWSDERFATENLTDERKAQYVEWAEKTLGQPIHFFEVKTLQKASQNRVRNTAKALERKMDWEQRYFVFFHTVIVDERKGKKNSGHRVYVAPYTAKKTVRLDECEKAGDFQQAFEKVNKS